MKRNLSVIFFVLAIISLLIVAGCAPSQPPVPTNIPPQTCSLTIYSQCWDCYGYVWVNGISTGKYLDFNGMVQVTVPCGVVSVELRDEYGWISHPEIVQTPQTSILIFNDF
ncbi:hypothetical protein [Atribacter laminatus]|uniref:PEGA domain-containing protein n=1 Tax=Atribacter laminatus TaxID=2847778 RepID=A0A7T1F3R3_ATRLM|nr:hypothetical protein [Atribacter laminatus]QPM68910.1 hypothetical protein RT761_02137 [Atribacter laminatus]